MWLHSDCWCDKIEILSGMWHVLKILELNSGNHRGFGFLCLCILGLEKLSDVHGKSLIFLVTKEWQPWCIITVIWFVV